MKRTLILAVTLLTTLASAQDLASYNKALSAYNGGDFDTSAKLFFDVSNTTTDPELKNKADYYLASSFQRLNLPFTAFIYFAPIVNAGPQHPFHLKAVEGVIGLQEVLHDDYLIPSMVNKLYDRYSDAWATLFTAYSRQPVWPYAGFALVATAVALVGVWKRKPRPLSAAPGAAKASGHRR